MSKSIKIFIGCYILGLLIIIASLITGFFSSNRDIDIGFLLISIMFFGAVPCLVIGLVGVIGSVSIKKFSKQIISRLDKMVAWFIIAVSILLLIIQIIGDQLHFW